MGELFVGGTELVEVPVTPGYLIDQGGDHASPWRKTAINRQRDFCLESGAIRWKVQEAY